MTTRGRLTGYLRYHVSDYLLQRASLPTLLVVVLTGLTLYSVQRDAPANLWTTKDGMNSARMMYQQLVALFLPLGAFLGAVQMMSVDRHLGHFRFLFSKPVSVVAYYAQQFVVHGVLFVALFGLITWAFGALTTHHSVRAAVEAAALTWVLIGGVGFFLGVGTRFDGALLALVYLVANITQQIAAAAGSAGESLPVWARLLAKGLPPVFKMDQLRSQLYAHAALDATNVWHVVGYGAGAFLIGLFLLRKLPLSR